MNHPIPASGLQVFPKSTEAAFVDPGVVFENAFPVRDGYDVAITLFVDHSGQIPTLGSYFAYSLAHEADELLTIFIGV